MNREQLMEQIFQVIEMGAQPLKITRHFDSITAGTAIEIEMFLPMNEERVRGPRRIKESPAEDEDIIEVECLGEEWDDDVPKELTNGW